MMLSLKIKEFCYVTFSYKQLFAPTFTDSAYSRVMGRVDFLIFTLLLVKSWTPTLYRKLASSYPFFAPLMIINENAKKGCFWAVFGRVPPFLRRDCRSQSQVFKRSKDRKKQSLYTSFVRWSQWWNQFFNSSYQPWENGFGKTVFLRGNHYERD